MALACRYQTRPQADGRPSSSRRVAPRAVGPPRRQPPLAGRALRRSYGADAIHRAGDDASEDGFLLDDEPQPRSSRSAGRTIGRPNDDDSERPPGRAFVRPRAAAAAAGEQRPRDATRARPPGVERPLPRRPPPPREAEQDDGGEEEEIEEDELQAGPAGGRDAFDGMVVRLRGFLDQQQVIRKESWEKLLGRMSSPRHAEQALKLLVDDARLRDSVGWDWGTHGYGQLVYQLVAAAAAADAPELAEDVLELTEALHITANKDLIPTLIRKLAAVPDAPLQPMLRLYGREAQMRRGNSPEAAYELSRALRRAEDVQGVRQLYGQMQQEGLAVRDRLLEDMQRWLGKRGVRV